MPTYKHEEITELAPSAKLVYKVLEYNDELTQKQIAEESFLSPRTVRSALTKLEGLEVVEHRIYPGDARQRLYRLAKSSSLDSE